MDSISWFAFFALVADLLLRFGLSIRVIMRRRPVGTTLAWVFIILSFPLAGAIIYLMFGELRLGRQRASRAKALHVPFQEWHHELTDRAPLDVNTLGPTGSKLARLVQSAIGLPPLPGNDLKLIDDWNMALRFLIDDIDAAQRTCHLEFYIWSIGGVADEVGEALLRATARGVTCRVLVDDVGSRKFLKSELCARLRTGGVRICGALRANLLRMLFVRFDLRMHRKIVVIDGRVGYTGSLNLVDPRYFKQDSHVGQWVDAMARIEGPAVEALAVTFLEDWSLESGASIEELRESGDVHPLRPRGGTPVQVIPSGPAVRSEAISRILLMAIYAAQRKLVLTTPYFVPDDSLLVALISAAERGVDVTLIMPAQVDSVLVRFASQAFKGDLVEAGVNVLLFEKGLLHTKSITIDDELALFGSLNLDPRSLFLNFEITLAIYDATFVAELVKLQEKYAFESRPMEIEAWRKRPALRRLAENTARLLGPLL